jgi:hypothetical protein
MAFNYSGKKFLSFANYDDVMQRDQRIFSSNEGLTEEVIDDLLALASQSILDKLRSEEWWKSYQFERDPSLKGDIRRLPQVDPDHIKFRLQAFKDVTVFLALADYILPRVADFSKDRSGADTAEVVKIKFYRERWQDTYKDILSSGDWYDFSGNGTIDINEKMPTRINLVRIR